MSRFRWYHYYFPLAVFNVIVIVLSLRLHQQGFDHFQDLIDAQRRLDTEATCLQAAQKAIMELNAPGNDLFGVRNRADYEKQRKRYEVANRNMAAVLSQMRGLSLDETRIAAQVEGMKSKAERLFAIFRPLVWGFETESSDGVSARSVMANIKSIGPSAIRRYALGVVGDLYAGLLMSLSAGPAMRDMDSHQHEALHAIATLSNKNAQRRLDLIEGQQADLGRQFRSQSFLIAGVLVILVGVLFFGRRLQEADKALALERERVKEARRERLAAIGELCSSVAHGIRNPLAAIRSSAQLALELGQLDGGTRERIQDILDEGGRLGDRVTGLLSMARANADAFGEVDLTSVVNVGVKGLLPEIERLGLILETDVSDTPVVVNGDRPRLEQCVVEYLSNAMEHSPEGGTIRVYCGYEGDSAVIAVEDDGPGVPRAVRDRVFDLFFTTKPAGTGIGLATVMRIARLHGGVAGLDEVSAGGARFTIQIPGLRATSRRRDSSRGTAAA